MKKLIIIACIILGVTSWSLAQNGVNFDGINDVIQTNYTGILGSADRTFEAWVFISANDVPSANLAILDYGVNIPGSRNTFAVSAAGGLFFISGGMTDANIVTEADAVPVNQWAHVAFVLESGIGYLYINGTQVDMGSLSAVDTPPDVENVKIGERVAGASIPFYGSLDEIRVWDVARTATEIHDNMDAELCGQHPNLQLYLQFNEGIAAEDNTGITTTADASGNGYNGSMNDFSLMGPTSNWINGCGISSGISTSFVQQSACETFSLTTSSTIYTTSGLYNETLIGANAAACDSIVTLDLTISNSSSSIDTQTACDSYTWIDGNTYTADNTTASYTLNSIAGCDSLITLDLTVNTVNSSVTQDGELLTANEIGAAYQWVECPEMTPISGATNQSYTPTVSGDYAVTVFDSLCSSTSACFTVTTVGTIEKEFANNLLVFPNPSNDEFALDLGKKHNAIIISIMDLNGNLILSNSYQNSQLLDLKFKEPSGVYFLIVESENKKAVTRLIKN